MAKNKDRHRRKSSFSFQVRSHLASIDIVISVKEFYLSLVKLHLSPVKYVLRFIRMHFIMCLGSIL